MKKYIVIQIIFALEMLRKPRHSTTKKLVYMQILNCTLYWFVMEEQNTTKKLVYIHLKSKKLLHNSTKKYEAILDTVECFG